MGRRAKSSLFDYVIPEPNTGCWLWNGMLKSTGYGRLKRRINGKATRPAAHRWAYEQTYGPIPDGLYVCHKCDTPPCVNPDHLFLGTAQDNVDDARRKGRMRHLRGEEHGMAILTARDVAYIRAAAELGFTAADMAPSYGVDRSTIRAVLLRKTWRTQDAIVASLNAPPTPPLSP